jgi:hypothetical protein
VDSHELSKQVFPGDEPPHSSLSLTSLETESVIFDAFLLGATCIDSLVCDPPYPYSWWFQGRFGGTLQCPWIFR